jgi:hypothetical protein
VKCRSNTKWYARIPAPLLLWFQKRADLLRTHDYVRSFHLWHEPSLLALAMPEVGNLVEVTVILKYEVKYITLSCFRTLCLVYCLPTISLSHLCAWRNISFILWICTWFSIWWARLSHSKRQRAGHLYVYPSLTQGWHACQVSITVYKVLKPLHLIMVLYPVTVLPVVLYWRRSLWPGCHTPMFCAASCLVDRH